MNVTVEGAWYALEANIRGEASAERIREARDNFILAVQAEMPCYMTDSGNYPCTDFEPPFVYTADEPLCPSCTARAALKVTA